MSKRDGSFPGQSFGVFFKVFIIYFWLCWVFVAVCRLSLVVVSASEVAQSYLTLCDPMDCSLPGSSIHGIFKARVLEWGAISFSRGIFPTRSPTLQADALPSELPGKLVVVERGLLSSCSVRASHCGAFPGSRACGLK